MRQAFPVAYKWTLLSKLLFEQVFEKGLSQAGTD